jgi:hypothetical protein
VEDNRISLDPDPEKVDTVGTGLTGKTPHPDSLGRIDRVDRLALTGYGSDLDSDLLLAVEGHDVDLAAYDLDVAGDNRQPVIPEEATGKALSQPPD